jgi:hypothetical protein
VEAEAAAPVEGGYAFPAAPALRDAIGRAMAAPAQRDADPLRSAVAPVPFSGIGRDFARFLSPDTVHALVPLGVAAMGVSPWDRRALVEAREHLPHSALDAGNLGGNFLVHAGASASVWAIGRATGSPEVSWLGSDLLRAQLLSQGVVQALKYGTRRPRPDGSNRHSFPSGHTATAFATASVLHQHYGWKVGIPAYAFGAYVGASRMSDNRHHLSDVLVGAAIGMVAGRTVTFGLRGQRFGLGMTAVPGGAAMTFTRVAGSS